MIIGWEHPQANKISIPNNTHIFSVDVEVLQDFENTIEITGSNVTVFGDNNLSGVFYSGEICVENVFQIEGEVLTENGLPRNII